jgi:hypothetical protein
MDKAIEWHIFQCSICQATTNKCTLPTAPQIALPDVYCPNQQMHIDLYDPMQDPEGTKQYVCHN